MGTYTIPPNNDWRIKQGNELLEFLDGMMYEGRGSWEQDFLLSIRQQLAEGRHPTDKQLDKLEEIYRRAANDI